MSRLPTRRRDSIGIMRDDSTSMLCNNEEGERPTLCHYYSTPFTNDGRS